MLPSNRQVEREWQWKLESKEQEVASLTARTRQVGSAGWMAPCRLGIGDTASNFVELKLIKLVPHVQ